MSSHISRIEYILCTENFMIFVYWCLMELNYFLFVNHNAFLYDFSYVENLFQWFILCIENLFHMLIAMCWNDYYVYIAGIHTCVGRTSHIKICIYIHIFYMFDLYIILWWCYTNKRQRVLVWLFNWLHDILNLVKIICNVLKPWNRLS